MSDISGKSRNRMPTEDELERLDALRDKDIDESDSPALTREDMEVCLFSAEKAIGGETHECP